MKTYEERVQVLESQGICRSDAQSIVDAEDMNLQRDAGVELYHALIWAQKYVPKKYQNVKSIEGLRYARMLQAIAKAEGYYNPKYNEAVR